MSKMDKFLDCFLNFLIIFCGSFLVVLIVLIVLVPCVYFFSDPSPKIKISTPEELRLQQTNEPSNAVLDAEIESLRDEVLHYRCQDMGGSYKESYFLGVPNTCKVYGKEYHQKGLYWIYEEQK